MKRENPMPFLHPEPSSRMPKRPKNPRFAADIFPSGAPDSFSGAGSAAATEDRLSELPDVLRLHILSLLPLKSAIRTGVLSSRWRGLWCHRWPYPSSLFLSSPSSGDKEEFVSLVDQSLAQRGRRRIDCLALCFQQGQALTADLKRWLEYGAACSVEDLVLHVLPSSSASSAAVHRRGSRRKSGAVLSFHFPMGSALLRRLTLRGVHLSAAASASTHLEVLSLHSISLTDAALRRVVAACPLLRSLDVRGCRELRRILVTASGPRFSSLTLVDCAKATELNVSSSPGLRSFRFSGSFLTKYSIDNANRLEEVYISSSGPGSALPPSNWVTSLGRLSNVRVITLCSNALQYIAVKGANAIGQLKNMQNLRELQLLMLMLSHSNLDDIFTFLRLYRCPLLEKLFIQLPTSTLDPYVEKYLEVAEEEPPEDCLEKLTTVKICNFKGHNYEMQLLRFILGKAPSLDSLAVLAPREILEEEFSADPLHRLNFLHVKLSLMPRVSKTARIFFSECEDYKFQPTHSEILSKF